MSVMHKLPHASLAILYNVEFYVALGLLIVRLQGIFQKRTNKQKAIMLFCFEQESRLLLSLYSCYNLLSIYCRIAFFILE